MIDPLFKQLLQNNSYVKELKNENKRLKKEKKEWKNKYNGIMSILHDYPGIINRRENVMGLTDDDDSVDLKASIIDFTNSLQIIKSENDSGPVITGSEFNNDLNDTNIFIKHKITAEGSEPDSDDETIDHIIAGYPVTDIVEDDVVIEPDAEAVVDEEEEEEEVEEEEVEFDADGNPVEHLPSKGTPCA